MPPQSGAELLKGVLQHHAGLRAKAKLMGIWRVQGGAGAGNRTKAGHAIHVKRGGCDLIKKQTT